MYTLVVGYLGLSALRCFNAVLGFNPMAFI